MFFMSFLSSGVLRLIGLFVFLRFLSAEVACSASFQA
jgi:hypothetical protein